MPELPGVTVSDSNARVYPFGGAFAHVIGYVHAVDGVSLHVAAGESALAGYDEGPVAVHTRDDRAHQLTDEQVHKLATITPYATGASIKDMVNEALVIAIRDERETITWADIVQAKQLKEHGLPDDHEYIERERHSVAVHEASHAVVTRSIGQSVSAQKLSIVARGRQLGTVVTPSLKS